MNTMKEYALKQKDFTDKMAKILAANHTLKGDSYKRMTWAELMDKITGQFEDMENDPGREDYFVNIANYAWMLWDNQKRQE